MKAKTNTAFWEQKIARNRVRDRKQETALRAAGWQVEVLWECQVKDQARLRRLARKLLAR